jgi:hypothetical protein
VVPAALQLPLLSQLRAGIRSLPVDVQLGGAHWLPAANAVHVPRDPLRLQA